MELADVPLSRLSINPPTSCCNQHAHDAVYNLIAIAQKPVKLSIIGIDFNILYFVADIKQSKSPRPPDGAIDSSHVVHISQPNPSFSIINMEDQVERLVSKVWEEYKYSSSDSRICK